MKTFLSLLLAGLLAPLFLLNAQNKNIPLIYTININKEKLYSFKTDNLPVSFFPIKQAMLLLFFKNQKTFYGLI